MSEGVLNEQKRYGRVIKVKCDYCGKEFERLVAEVNRSRRLGVKLFCNNKCFGLNRRANKTIEQKKAEKAIYDKEYRAKNYGMLKNKKKAYYDSIKDDQEYKEKCCIYRKKNMPRHIEYCRRPEYRAKKKIYDREYKAKKFYGDFWESHILTMDIRGECLNQMSDYDIRISKGTLTKTQKRRRKYEKAQRGKLEAGIVGDLKQGQRR